MRSALKASTASPVLLMCSKRPRIYPQGYTHTPPLPSQSPSLLPKLETSDPPGLLRLPQGPRGFPTSSFCPVSAVTVQNLIFSSLSSGTSLLVSLPLPFPSLHTVAEMNFQEPFYHLQSQDPGVKALHVWASTQSSSFSNHFHFQEDGEDTLSPFHLLFTMKTPARDTQNKCEKILKAE